MSSFVVEAYASEVTAKARALNVGGTVVGPVSRVLAGVPGATPPEVWVDKQGGPWWLVTFSGD